MTESTPSSESTQERRGSRPRRGGGRFRRRPRVCQFCAEQTQVIDYKQVEVLKRLVDESGKIRSRRQTGTCARHQRMVAKAVKRARHMALLPFAAERLR